MTTSVPADVACWMPDAAAIEPDPIDTTMLQANTLTKSLVGTPLDVDMIPIAGALVDAAVLVTVTITFWTLALVVVVPENKIPKQESKQTRHAW